MELICPICGNALTQLDKRFVCENRHSFDIARQGYVNLLTVQQKHSLVPGDTREQVLSRRSFLEAGHYAPICQTLIDTAKSLGITEYRSQVLPEDKARVVQELKDAGRTVLMLGDGINDSPALSCANVGVTLRDGSDLAREVADVVLMGGSLNELVTALELGRGTMRRVHGNFVATMGLNSLFLAGGLVGLIQPGLSAVLHNLTTLGVSLGAMRPVLGGR